MQNGSVEALEITHKPLSTRYQVRAPGADRVVMTVRDLRLTEGEDGKGEVVASLKPNFWGTRSTIYGGDGAELGFLAFRSPLSLSSSARKTFELHLGGAIYRSGYHVDDTAGRVSSGTFRCADAAGELAVEITKELSLVHRFTVRFAPSVGRELSVLAAIAIDQRFFRMQ